MKNQTLLQLLWYGFKNKKYNLKVQCLKKKNNAFIKKYSILRNTSLQLNKQNFRIYKPSSWDLYLINDKSKKTTSLALLTSTYFIKVPIPTSHNNLSFDKNTNVFKLHSLYVNNNYRMFYKSLSNALKSFYLPTILKIKFKGKGYYVYKNKRNTITPQFGYAHRLYLYSYFVSAKFLSKTSILLFGFCYQDLKQVGLGLKSMRPINIFTGRGVRFSKQIIYKKVGKVSSYR